MTVAERRTKARRMHRKGEGKTVREIAEALGVSVGTAHRYVNPEAAERYRIATRERKRRQAERQTTNGREVNAT
jgi:DNA-directed RNA polymerase specialized sigma24 family protein